MLGVCCRCMVAIPIFVILCGRKQPRPNERSTMVKPVDSATGVDKQTMELDGAPLHVAVIYAVCLRVNCIISSHDLLHRLAVHTISLQLCCETIIYVRH